MRITSDELGLEGGEGAKIESTLVKMWRSEAVAGRLLTRRKGGRACLFEGLHWVLSLLVKREKCEFWSRVQVSSREEYLGEIGEGWTLLAG